MTTSFHSLGLPEPIVTSLSRQGLTEPFAIQATAIPQALAGRDIQGRAPTGSGKTLAFGLPLLTMVETARPGRPRALILAPTRELAEQIRRDLDPIANAVGRRIAAIFGGVGYGPQRQALKRGVDVLVATPGRLEDLIEQGSVHLGDVEIAVLDEADRMADMGFVPAVRRILDQTNRNRQTLLFSATLDGDVSVLSRRYQDDPVHVEADGHDHEDLDIAHHFWNVPRSDRVSRTAEVIRGSDRTLVFTRTRRGADRLARQLSKSGVAAVPMHGGLSQNQRTRALRAFSNGNVQALIATDVAARGIHVENVGVVVHYDPANDPKDYLHRSGRTGRAGAAGTVISFVSEGQAGDARRIQKALHLDQRIGSPDMGRLGRRASEVHASPRQNDRVDSQPVRRPTSTAPSRRLFVGNLAWRSTAKDLERHFADHGTVVSATISTKGNSGRSKGFGLVEMPESDGERAIEALNGSTLNGRPIRVRPAR